MRVAILVIEPPLDQSNLDRWGYVLPAFQPIELFVSGVTGKLPRPFHSATLVDSLAEVPGALTPVVVTPRNASLVAGTTPLPKFHHPRRALYVFGPDNGSLSRDHLGGILPRKRTFIPCTVEEDLYASTAAAIVLYDRIANHG